MMVRCSNSWNKPESKGKMKQEEWFFNYNELILGVISCFDEGNWDMFHTNEGSRLRSAIFIEYQKMKVMRKSSLEKSPKEKRHVTISFESLQKKFFWYWCLTQIKGCCFYLDSDSIEMIFVWVAQSNLHILTLELK